MEKRALVMGGGGTVGIAWETGLAAGLLEQGVHLGEADLIIGTSAGSVVGAQLAAGYDPRLVLQMHRAMAGAVSGQAERAAFDAEVLGEVFARWGSAGEMSPEVRRELGALALKAKTVPEDTYIGTIAQVTGVPEWPERRLLLTAVDAGSGEFVVWERGGAAPLERAVAASCCVPGIFPPVTIDGRRYVDGGVRSGTNADLAEGCGVAVIIAPLGERQFPHGRLAMEQEIALLRAGGGTVELVLPDAESLEAFGPDMMDASRIVPAAEAGYRQGLALAGRLQTIWHA